MSFISSKYSYTLPTSFDNIILEEIKLHPALQFVDLYKLLYQVNFGPSHFLHFSGRLEDEFNKVEPSPGMLLQRIGWEFPLYRLNISPYKYREGKLTPLMDLVKKTAHSSIFPAYDFPSLLSTLLDFLSKKKELKHLADEGKNFLEKLEGFPVLSHSEIYRELYSPHYVVVLVDNDFFSTSSH